MVSSSPRLKVVIIGGGIAGLATAFSIARKSDFQVTVLERHLDLTEVGAGIQITPNAARVLCKWGLRREFEDIATVPDFNEVRRYSDGELRGNLVQNAQGFSEKMYGYPHWLVHRADYQQVLGKAAREAGVRIEFDKRVLEVKCGTQEVVLDDGVIVAADLVIGADGIWSKTRMSMPENVNVKPTTVEESCFRFLVPREKMMSDPKTAPLMNELVCLVYAGQKKAVIAYPVAKGQVFNVALPVARPGDALLAAAYNAPGDVNEMRELYQDFDEPVRHVLQHTSSCVKWGLADLPPLPSWTSGNGRVVLVGDAAHAMLPWIANGGGTAIEDAAFIGELLAMCKTADDISSATKVYENLRRQRCERIQQLSWETRHTFTLVDGPKQEARDRGMKEAMITQEQELIEDSFWQNKPAPDINAPFPSPAARMWIYSYDAIQEAQNQLNLLN